MCSRPSVAIALTMACLVAFSCFPVSGMAREDRWQSCKESPTRECILEEALNRTDEAPTHKQPSILLGIANMFVQMGRRDDSLRLMEAALERANAFKPQNFFNDSLRDSSSEPLGDSLIAINTRARAASIYAQLGLFSRSMELLAKVPERRLRLETVAEIAAIHGRNGNPREANRLLQYASSEARLVENPKEQSVIFRTIARVQADLGRFNEATGTASLIEDEMMRYETIQSIIEKQISKNNLDDAHRTSSLLPLPYRDMGLSSIIKHHLEKGNPAESLRIFRSLQDIEIMALVALDIADFYASRGNDREFEKFMDRAFELARSIPPQSILFRELIFVEIARILSKHKNYTRAIMVLFDVKSPLMRLEVFLTIAFHKELHGMETAAREIMAMASHEFRTNLPPSPINLMNLARIAEAQSELGDLHGAYTTLMYYSNYLPKNKDQATFKIVKGQINRSIKKRDHMHLMQAIMIANNIQDVSVRHEAFHMIAINFARIGMTANALDIADNEIQPTESAAILWQIAEAIKGGARR